MHVSIAPAHLLHAGASVCAHHCVNVCSVLARLLRYSPRSVCTGVTVAVVTIAVTIAVVTVTVIVAILGFV